MTRRIAALRSIMADRGIDSLLICDLTNVRYLSDFTGSNGALLVRSDNVPIFITDGRYQDQARMEVAARIPEAEFLITRTLAEDVVTQGLTHAETHHLPVDVWRELGEPAASGPVVEELRLVKDDTEIAHLREACRISGEALTGLLAGPLVGRSERELARELEWRMLELGAEDKGFETILASGENTAIPHHNPTDRIVGADELLKIDFGARVAGYHADCTRTVVTGAADDWQREVYAVVRASQQAGVDALTGGNELASAYQAAVDTLADAGWLEYFTTGLGHGVGLQIHEDPYFSGTATGRLASRTVLTMEPGIYVPGRGGVRIEDTVLVTDPGGVPEVLTTTTKELLEIS